MKILAIDTSTKYLCIAVYDNGKRYGYTLETGRKLSALITVSIQRVAQALPCKMEAIDYFACGLGPGSFTGLRIGLATMKGCAWSLKKPLVGVSTLDILVGNALHYADRDIVPALDAKRGLMYCSVYRIQKGAIRRIKPYMLLDTEEFRKKVKPGSVILGDAVGLYRDNFLRSVRDCVILDKDFWYPRGDTLIDLALERIRDKKTDDVFKIKPIYLYPKECQIRLK